MADGDGDEFWADELIGPAVNKKMLTKIILVKMYP
jgi:hypothetical protein